MTKTATAQDTGFNPNVVTPNFTAWQDSFKGFDFSKMMGEMRFPTMDIDAIMVAQRKNMEALQQANQLALEGIQAIAKRQAEIAAQTVQTAGGLINQIVSAATPEEKFAKQTDILKAAYEKMLINTKELSDLANKAGAEAAGVINHRFVESLDEVKAVAKKK